MAATFPQLVQRLSGVLTPARLPYYLAALLLPQVALFLALETTPGVLDRQERVRGRDFLAFYVYGDIVRHHDAQRVYDDDYFRQVQEDVASIDFDKGRPRAHPLYPPNTGLLFAALASMPYDVAVVVWWLVLLGCFAVSFVLLLCVLNPTPAWRWTAILALAAFTPVSSTFWNGQLAALLLLAFIAGLQLHRSDRRFLAGLVFAVLALKPQLGAGLGLWLLLRRDFRTIAGCCLGVLAQVGLAALLLGPDLFVRYATEGVPLGLRLPLLETITPDHQHALAGILTNCLGAEHAGLWKAIHLALTLGCAVLLYLVVRGRRVAGASSHKPEARARGTPGPLARASGLCEEAPALDREYAAAVLFVVFAAPHLHTYDLVLLLIPIAHLLTAAHGPGPREETGLGALLYVAAALPFVYTVTRVSLVPLVIVLVLYRLARLATLRRATYRRAGAPVAAPGPAT